MFPSLPIACEIHINSAITIIKVQIETDKNLIIESIIIFHQIY